MAVTVVHSPDCQAAEGGECVPGCRWVELKSVLQPVALTRLAEAIRDEEWVDVRTGEKGIFERVQVSRIIVLRTREEVILTQGLPDTDDSGNLLAPPEWTVDADDIMWMKPTVFEAEDVERPKARSDTDEPETTVPGIADDIYFCIRHVMAKHYRRPVDEIDIDLSKKHASGRGPAQVVFNRHLTLWLMYELSDESASMTCGRMGYRSPMAFHSARDKFMPLRWGPDAGKPSPFQGLVRDLVRKIRQMSGEDWRRSGDVSDSIL